MCVFGTPFRSVARQLSTRWPSRSGPTSTVRTELKSLAEVAVPIEKNPFVMIGLPDVKQALVPHGRPCTRSPRGQGFRLPFLTGSSRYLAIVTFGSMFAHRRHDGAGTSGREPFHSSPAGTIDRFRRLPPGAARHPAGRPLKAPPTTRAATATSRNPQ